MSAYNSATLGTASTRGNQYTNLNSNDFYPPESSQPRNASQATFTASMQHPIYPQYHGEAFDSNAYGARRHANDINHGSRALFEVFQSAGVRTWYIKETLHRLRFCNSGIDKGFEQDRFLLERSRGFPGQPVFIGKEMLTIGVVAMFQAPFSQHEAELALITDNALNRIGLSPEQRSSSASIARCLEERRGYVLTQKLCAKGISASWWPKWFVKTKEIHSFVDEPVLVGIVRQLDGTDGFGFATLIELPDDGLVKFLIICYPHFRCFDFTINRDEFLKYNTIYERPVDFAGSMMRDVPGLKKSPQEDNGSTGDLPEQQADGAEFESYSKTARTFLDENDDSDASSSVPATYQAKIPRDCSGLDSILTSNLKKLPSFMLPLFERASTASIAEDIKSSFGIAGKYAIPQHISSDEHGLCKTFSGYSRSDLAYCLFYAFGLSKFELKYGNKGLNRRRVNHLATLLESDKHIETFFCYGHIWVVHKSTEEEQMDLLEDSSTWRSTDDTYLEEEFFQQDSGSKESKVATTSIRQAEATAIENEVSLAYESDANGRMVDRRRGAQRRLRQRKRARARAAKSASTGPYNGELARPSAGDNGDLSSLEMPPLLVADENNIGPGTTRTGYDMVAISAALGEVNLE